MVDPVEYLIKDIVNPKLDTTMLMVTVIGIVLFILWMIMYFLNNKTLQAMLFNIHEKISLFIENKRINVL